MGSATEEFQVNFKALVDLTSKEIFLPVPAKKFQCKNVPCHLQKTVGQLKVYFENDQMRTQVSRMEKNMVRIISNLNEAHTPFPHHLSEACTLLSEELRFLEKCPGVGICSVMLFIILYFTDSKIERPHPCIFITYFCGNADWRAHKMAEDWSRSTYRFSEHIRRMQAHLYLLLLAVGISAAPQVSSMAELLTLLQEMGESMTRDAQTLRIETPDNVDGECDTERKNARLFIQKLITFIRKASKDTRA
ncbi:interleukin-5-like [Limosa lapponica baueri]|uniref:Interleukin-5-like n=1 Tax=Limosa lapponica baueri TaxID=1758121 RepID=A0A2I0TT38_LIMLA|nr:interleukin-5-like [Limosa lapponica baueri]